MKQRFQSPAAVFSGGVFSLLHGFMHIRTNYLIVISVTHYLIATVKEEAGLFEYESL